MLFTERKALEEMFRYLEDDKRTIKAQARQDIENIENRQMVLLDRLERLDKVDREAVDVEGVLQSLATTSKELAALIPSVPFTDVLERAAEKIAEAPENQDRISNQPPRNIMREKIVEAAQIQKLQEPIRKPNRQRSLPGKHAPKGIGKAEGFILLVSFLTRNGKPMRARELQNAFETQTGVIYANFHSKIKEWVAHDPGKIIKEGKYYRLKEHEENGEQRNTEEKTHNEPGNRSETHS